jgi:hypothetical protein
MGEHEKRPIEATTTERSESEQGGCPACSKGTFPLAVEAAENAAWDRPECNWEGYSPEILSIWFDP